eukprot:TRINITY_DN26030_c0_g1_i2.p1 TRINITY_DN26030_c0_g1~~TRINITY_DN26030_c0_g1_i2.p1  ORF type:complete len:582 (-),score=84.47 TRINITY_DN26030_c0_g1_i2:36-1781(-)
MKARSNTKVTLAGGIPMGGFEVELRRLMAELSEQLREDVRMQIADLGRFSGDAHTNGGGNAHPAVSPTLKSSGSGNALLRPANCTLAVPKVQLRSAQADTISVALKEDDEPFFHRRKARRMTQIESTAQSYAFAPADCGPRPNASPRVPLSQRTQLDLVREASDHSRVGLIDSTSNVMHKESDYEDGEILVDNESAWSAIATSKAMEVASAVLLLVNAVWLGVCIEMEATNYPTSLPPWFTFVDLGFCVCFSCELLLRIIGLRLAFFVGPGSWWNLFDTVVIGLTIVDTGTTFSSVASGLTTTAGVNLRSIRLFRMVRFVRIIRLLRLVEELQTIVASIVSSLRSLVWTLILLLIFIYALAACLTQIIIDHRHAREPHQVSEKIDYWYGSLSRTALTLYQSITDGAGWDEALMPLVTEVSPWLAPVILGYISFAVFAVLNVVTGVFVQKASLSAESDRGEMLKTRVCEVFRRRGSERDTLTLDDFNEMLDEEEIREYFKAIDVDLSCAALLFEILDTSSTGSMDIVDFISGCMRLRGQAQALHVEILMHETRRMNDIALHVMDDIVMEVTTLRREIRHLRS